MKHTETLFSSGKSRLLSTFIALVMGLPAGAALAADEDEVIEEVVVKGFRGSLMQARDLKRNALVSQDSIAAEDIAAFPDLNLAESLQRIPGVTITREGGEGRQISLRGLGPDFTRVKVNGMEALGTSASTLDARGAVTRTRGFDFNIFASELFTRIDVFKSYSAEQSEGGLGGTVNLNTARPFDYGGYKAVAGAQLGTNSNTDAADPRVVGLISNTWDNFGALVSVAYSERETEEYGVNTTRWRKRADATAGAGLSDQLRAQVENGEIWFPRGIRDSAWLNDQERLGVTASLQFRPADNFTLSLDALYGEMNNSKTEFHLVNTYSLPRGHEIISLETETVQGDAPTTDAGGDIQLVNGSFIANDQTMVTEARADQSDSTFMNVVLSGEWDVSSRFRADFLLGTTSADLDKPQSDKAYTRNQAGIPVAFDINCRSFECSRTIDSSFNTGAPDQWEYRDLRFREDYISNGFDNVQLNFRYDMTDAVTLKFGVEYKNYENSNERYDVRNTDSAFDQISTFEPADSSLLANAPEGYRTFTRSDGQSWIVADLTVRQAAYGASDLDLRALGEDFGRSRPTLSIEEETMAFYGQLDFEFGDLRGNFGFRSYDTEAEGNGFDEFGNAQIFTSDYSDVLPAMNLAYSATDNLILRASASANINRPPLGALNPSFNVRTDANLLDIRGGAPDLEHMESTDFEVSAEYYFDDNSGYIALAYYSKNIDNFITEFSQPVRYGDTGLDLSLLDGAVDENGDPQTADTIYQLKGLVNIPNAEFSGFEVTVEKDFTFLPGEWRNLGIRASYTSSDGDTDYPNVQQTTNSSNKSFVGLSDTSYATTLYYENDVWGLRVSQNYRDDYISRVEVGLGDEDERGFHETNFIDFAAFYYLNDNIKLTFKANNLTDEKEELYTDSSDRLYAVTTSGRNYYAGAIWEF